MFSSKPAHISRGSSSSKLSLQRRLPMLRLIRWLVGRPSVTNKLSVPYLEVDDNYEAPFWAQQLSTVPKFRMGLGVLPTPIHQWHLPGLPDGVQVFIKRDDLTGMQLSGNKVRKLEFLMADAKRSGHDCVITIGGIQSNHCRATAVAARYCGLDCHLILRTSRQLIDEDPGLVGNLLLGRMVGAHVHLVTKEEYTRHGSMALGQKLVQQLTAQGHKPYLIPVGGSNALGTWGYLQAVEEIRLQSSSLGITDLAMACGSGGTTAGLALGVNLAGLNIRVHGFGVCDTPDYFYNHVDELLEEMGAAHLNGGIASRALFRAVQSRGSGYAISTTEELNTIKEVCEATGILLDPVYGGKAVHSLLQEIRSNPDAWRGRRVLFVHTGGLLGMYDKVDQLQALYESDENPVDLNKSSSTRQQSVSRQGTSGLVASTGGADVAVTSNGRAVLGQGTSIGPTSISVAAEGATGTVSVDQDHPLASTGLVTDQAISSKYGHRVHRMQLV